MILTEKKDQRRKRCVECGDKLTIEMEYDRGICVCCQEERALTREEIDDELQKHDVLLDSETPSGSDEAQKG